MKVVYKEKYEQSDKSDHPPITKASDSLQDGDGIKVKSMEKEKQQAPLS
jgi:deoxycytidylate deaminase